VGSRTNKRNDDKRASDHLVQAVSFDDFATRPNNGDLWADEER
jgi:hypothetical protein